MLEFHHMTEDIEAALSKLPIDKLGISDEVREQVQLLPHLHEFSLYIGFGDCHFNVLFVWSFSVRESWGLSF